MYGSEQASHTHHLSVCLLVCLSSAIEQKKSKKKPVFYLRFICSLDAHGASNLIRGMEVDIYSFLDEIKCPRVME